MVRQSNQFDGLIDAWKNRKQEPVEARELILGSSDRLIEAVSAYLRKNIKLWAERYKTEHEKFLLEYYGRQRKPGEKYLTKRLKSRKGKYLNKETREFLKEERKIVRREAKESKQLARLEKYKRQREVLRKTAYREKEHYSKGKDLRTFKTTKGKLAEVKRSIKATRSNIKSSRSFKASERRYEKIDRAMVEFTGERWFNLQLARLNKGQISQETFENILLKKL